MTTVHISFKTSNLESLLIYGIFLKTLFKKLNIDYSIINLPKKTKKLTLNKSTHVNKTAREQFELKVFKMVFILRGSLKALPLKYIFLNKPKTLSLKIKKIN